MSRSTRTRRGRRPDSPRVQALATIPGVLSNGSQEVHPRLPPSRPHRRANLPPPGHGTLPRAPLRGAARLREWRLRSLPPPEARQVDREPDRGLRPGRTCPVRPGPRGRGPARRETSASTASAPGPAWSPPEAIPKGPPGRDSCPREPDASTPSSDPPGGGSAADLRARACAGDALRIHGQRMKPRPSQSVLGEQVPRHQREVGQQEPDQGRWQRPHPRHDQDGQDHRPDHQDSREASRCGVGWRTGTRERIAVPHARSLPTFAARSSSRYYRRTGAKSGMFSSSAAESMRSPASRTPGRLRRVPHLPPQLGGFAIAGEQDRSSAPCWLPRARTESFPMRWTEDDIRVVDPLK